MTEREELLRRIDSLHEAIRQGRLHAGMIGMAREEREAIERLLDKHYSELCLLRDKVTAMTMVAPN